MSRSNPSVMRDLMLLIAIILVSFCSAIYVAQKNIEDMHMDSAYPMDTTASCTTDDECGCTDDCLDSSEQHAEKVLIGHDQK